MELVYPKNYTTMSNDEMMVTDGGVYKKNVWYGIRIYYTPAEAKREINYLNAITAGAAATGIGLGLLSFGFGAVSAAFVGFYSNTLSDSLSGNLTTKGVILNMTHAAVFWSEGR